MLVPLSPRGEGDKRETIVGNILIPLGIIVGISVLSWVFQQVKKASEEQKRQQQVAAPQARRTGPKTGGSDIDRFLQEIDKLRAGGKPTPKAAPKPPPPPKPAPQAKKVRLGEQAAPTFKTTAAPVAAARSIGTDDLPVATVVGPARSGTTVATAGTSVATIATVATIARPTDAGFRAAKSAISSKITELLANPQSAAIAVALNEILGPPKTNRRRR